MELYIYPRAGDRRFGGWDRRSRSGYRELEGDALWLRLRARLYCLLMSWWIYRLLEEEKDVFAVLHLSGCLLSACLAF